MSNPSPPDPPGTTTLTRWLKPAVFLVCAAAFLVFSKQFGPELSLEKLAEREAALRQLVAERPWQIYGAAFLIYLAVTGLSLPGAGVLSLAYGWLFKFWPALIIVSFASSIGATTAFLLSRFLFRDFIQGRFGDRLLRFNDALHRDGAFYLFTLRLIPGVPYFVINAVMGLTPIRTWTFYWVSQLGMLAGTAVFVYAGSSVGSLDELAEKGPAGILHRETIIAFVLLGLFSLVVNRGLKAYQSRRGETDRTIRAER